AARPRTAHAPASNAAAVPRLAHLNVLSAMAFVLSCLLAEGCLTVLRNGRSGLNKSGRCNKGRAFPSNGYRAPFAEGDRGGTTMVVCGAGASPSDHAGRVGGIPARTCIGRGGESAGHRA